MSWLAIVLALSTSGHHRASIVGTWVFKLPYFFAPRFKTYQFKADGHYVYDEGEAVDYSANGVHRGGAVWTGTYSFDRNVLKLHLTDFAVISNGVRTSASNPDIGITLKFSCVVDHNIFKIKFISSDSTDPSRVKMDHYRARDSQIEVWHRGRQDGSRFVSRDLPGAAPHSVDWSRPHPVVGLDGLFVERVPHHGGFPKWDFSVVDARGVREMGGRSYGMNVWVNLDTGVCHGRKSANRSGLSVLVARGEPTPQWYKQ